MSAPILDRLNARIAAEPALDHLDTLFVDLQDARDAIVAAVAQNTSLKDMLSAPAAGPSNGGPTPSTEPTSVNSAVALLVEAKERLGVHALSTVGDNIDKAINLLGG